MSMMSVFSAESSFIGERRDPQPDVQEHYGNNDGDEEVAKNFQILLHQQSLLQGAEEKDQSSLMDDMESMIMSKHEELLMLGVL